GGGDGPGRHQPRLGQSQQPTRPRRLRAGRRGAVGDRSPHHRGGERALTANAARSQVDTSAGEGMKVLITGGMGVIGAEASRRFVREGHRPLIFARHRDEWLIRDILEDVDIELCDVLDMPRLRDGVKGHRFRHIVHAAAFVGAVSAANPGLSVQVNVMGMVNVLEAARAFDVARVVYTSAKGVYGPVLGEYGAPTYKP